MESRFPAMLVLWLGRELCKVKHEVMGSVHSWTPNLGEKSMIPENATLFSISLLGKEICLNIRENFMCRDGLSERIYKDCVCGSGRVVVDPLERL
ncbi:hypothetical protein AVEN_22466-1 [Araneus ventricosus]|uniref:Uncharacterized protein n=1 Tax=Araneus ventricosus TaxID=182803 RepID=A0A4Y2MGD9_ARAVE|nr:hypothetical protein AVEN_22466-1 [Araneus ventricosus]